MNNSISAARLFRNGFAETAAYEPMMDALEKLCSVAPEFINAIFVFEVSNTKKAKGDWSYRYDKEFNKYVHRIRISKRLLLAKDSKATYKHIYSTCIHEMAHALEYVKHGKTSHGRRFRNYMGVLGHPVDSRCTPLDEDSRWGYAEAEDVTRFRYVRALLSDDGTAEVIDAFFKKPRKKLERCFLDNDITTKGKLFDYDLVVDSSVKIGDNFVPKKRNILNNPELKANYEF